MVVRSLDVRSYKSFLRPVSFPLSPECNVFIGPNNCGKTNLLDAIDFLAHPEKDPSRLHHHRANMEAAFSFNDAEAKRFGMHGVTIVGKHYTVEIRGHGGEAVTEEIEQYVSSRVRMLSYESFTEFEQIESDYLSLAQKYPEVFDRFSRLMRQHFPEIEGITTIVDEATEDFGSVSLGSRSITIDRLGGGFRRVLVMLLYALHPDYSIILIDEPEIHLHPGMIKKLLHIIHGGAMNQLIVTTHSPLFITAEWLSQVYRVLKDEQGSTVYSLAQQPVAIDRQRLVQELNADNLEMFFADKVLVVEGVSDRILMRGLIDRFYQGSLDIKVIYTHGKSNIDIYRQLMSCFHIPYLVMLDRDALPAIADELHIRHLLRHDWRESNTVLAAELLKHHIVILDNGSIEQNYPKQYQRDDSKPLNALFASVNITPEEFQSPRMKNLRDIIQNL
ncbi:MAG: hypothetical protein A3B30_02520 [Candidatus Komeilibacteria bacterium RIFCSPLOWO2_01_FULL_52_15]|uniref:AAA+ ATPase domain-containing protein n=1 Tax=Candidatus Komeilibacteria bacterium RIFCSPLOWO2_01_FULL_52_15 TaxID=1798551 RepID=A0A1G2BT23_9BACT|nr:MAG: hypothetical protein A3B30_02520 [Candidatus Komeilibacteria bacterium RIFCSPLOWO2_01_FULL_52_15]